MASVFRKTVTRALPSGAELITRNGEKLARWKNRSGKVQTAPVRAGKNGEMRIRVESGTYTAKYRDGQGILREVSTRCRSKDAALAVLKELTDRAEKVRSGILTTAEDAISDHRHTPMQTHIESYLDDHRNRGSSSSHLEGIEIRLNRLQREIQLVRLGDLNAESISRWLSARLKDGMAGRTRNSYLEVLKAFCNWCVETDRLASNPLAKLRKADQCADRRIVRRSMTVDELQKLLYVASRP